MLIFRGVIFRFEFFFQILVHPHIHMSLVETTSAKLLVNAATAKPCSRNLYRSPAAEKHGGGESPSLGTVRFLLKYIAYSIYIYNNVKMCVYIVYIK